MLRFLIGTGLLLMIGGFGAAGWQYWRGPLPGEAAVAAENATDSRGQTRTWLVSATGAPVPRAEAQAFLEQDRFAPGRSVTLTLTAPLSDLLAADEKLPDDPYLQVLADIRAPKIAQGFCMVLTRNLAQACAVNAARVVEGSVDPVRGRAGFRVELVYRLKPEAEGLPDLAAQVFDSRTIEPEIAAEAAATAETALAAVMEAAVAACPDSGRPCRLMEIALDWSPAAAASARARIAWLSPMPQGMFAAPPLGARGGN